jgi:hypothetical protein
LVYEVIFRWTATFVARCGIAAGIIVVHMFVVFMKLSEKGLLVFFLLVREYDFVVSLSGNTRGASNQVLYSTICKAG